MTVFIALLFIPLHFSLSPALQGRPLLPPEKPSDLKKTPESEAQKENQVTENEIKNKPKNKVVKKYTKKIKSTEKETLKDKDKNGTEANWHGNLLALLWIERYKPLYDKKYKRHEKSSQTGERPSRVSQTFFLGFRLTGKQNTTPKNMADFIYGLDAMLLSNLGFWDGVHNSDQKDKTGDFTFLPGENLFLGLCLPLKNSLQSRILLGRKKPRELESELLGNTGSLTGLFWEFQEKNYGRLQLILHQPTLAGDFLTKDGAIYEYNWQERLEQQRQGSQAMGQRLEWSLGYNNFFIGFYSDLQRHKVRLGDILDDSEASPTATTPPLPPDFFENHRKNTFTKPTVSSVKANQASALILRYTGLGIGFSNNPEQSTAHSSPQKIPKQKERFLYKAYLSIERLDGSLPSLLKNEEGKYERIIRAHALRAGFAFSFLSWFIKSSFFLPTSQSHPQGSQAKTSEESGYIGFGRHPSQGTLIRNTLHLVPWYEPCPYEQKASPFAESGCEGLLRQSDELQMHRPSAVWNLRLGYQNARVSLALVGSLFAPLALSEGHPGANPFKKLKKDSELFSYREIGIVFLYQIQESGALQFRYNRLYRVRPANLQSPLRKLQRRKSSLAAEFFGIEFSKNIF